MRRGREVFHNFEPAFIFFANLLKIMPVSVKTWMLAGLRNFNGYLGLGLRYILIKSLAKSCGRNVSIHPGVFVFGLDKIKIGDNVSIHPGCYIDATGSIDIGDDVSIAHFVTVLSTEHYYASVDFPIKDQGVYAKKTVIESNVWIGAGSRILAGSRIENGAIVAAGAVVRGGVPKDQIWGGVPAKYLKSRIQETSHNDQ